MVFVNKVTCNFFAFVVVIVNTKNTFSKKANLLNCFSCFPIIVIIVKFYFCCLAFNKVNLLFVQITKLQNVFNKFFHYGKLPNLILEVFVIWQKVLVVSLRSLWAGRWRF